MARPRFGPMHHLPHQSVLRPIVPELADHDLAHHWRALTALREMPARAIAGIVVVAERAVLWV